jgi:hypothetical protein
VRRGGNEVNPASSADAVGNSQLARLRDCVRRCGSVCPECHDATIQF